MNRVLTELPAADDNARQLEWCTAVSFFTQCAWERPNDREQQQKLEIWSLHRYHNFSTRSLNGVGPDRPLMFRSPTALHQQTNYVNDTRVSFILPKNRLLTVCLITSSYRFNMASVMPPPLPKPATTTDAPISIKLKRKADDLSNPESYPNDDEVSFVACILNQ